MKANEIARATGVCVHTIRYYQRIGLLAPPRDAQNGYHQFSMADGHAVHFIKRAQGVGLTLDEIRVIFERAKHRCTPCPEVREMVRQRLYEVEHRLLEWTELHDRMRRALRDWRRLPDGTPNGRDVCRLIESLGEFGSAQFARHEAEQQTVARGRAPATRPHRRHGC
jgi:DNA-binding transcriptional MerR regulator